MLLLLVNGVVVVVIRTVGSSPECLEREKDSEFVVCSSSGPLPAPSRFLKLELVSQE